MKIYYAHSQWEYGTPQEEYNIQLIKRAFRNAEILNPSEFINPNDTEGEILLSCMNKIELCPVVVFSTFSGIVGRGVAQELLFAESAGKLVYEIYGGKVHLTKDIRIEQLKGEGASDRTYGVIYS